MPRDLGGLPHSEGGDDGGEDEAFDAVVFDESFVRSAPVHEPTAEERILAAVEARLEREAAAGANRPAPVTDPAEAGDPAARRDMDDADWAEYSEYAEQDGSDDPSAARGGRPGRGVSRRGGARPQPPRAATSGGYGGLSPQGRYRVGHWYGGPPDGFRAHHARAMRRQTRQWQRAVAWLLALVMGLGVVLLAAAAVYRGVNGAASQPSRAPGSGQSSAPARSGGSGVPGGAVSGGGSVSGGSAPGSARLSGVPGTAAGSVGSGVAGSAGEAAVSARHG